ncbi:MAG: methylated-DNA--[protein]-cysteine S-methyltransferase [bacterium]
MILSAYLFNTDLDSVAIVWHKAKGKVKIKEIIISSPKYSAEQSLLVRYPDSTFSLSKEIELLAEKIKRYCKGEKESFSLELYDFTEIKKFRKDVYLTLYETKRGEKISYGELALRAGYPGAARAVGTAMKNNPFPFVIPCHRVIKSDGSIGGFFGAEEMKEKLLKMEEK